VKNALLSEQFRDVIESEKAKGKNFIDVWTLYEANSIEINSICQFGFNPNCEYANRFEREYFTKPVNLEANRLKQLLLLKISLTSPEGNRDWTTRNLPLNMNSKDTFNLYKNVNDIIADSSQLNLDQRLIYPQYIINYAFTK
jgi:hypothetical protein